MHSNSYVLYMFRNCPAPRQLMYEKSIVSGSAKRPPATDMVELLGKDPPESLYGDFTIISQRKISTQP